MTYSKPKYLIPSLGIYLLMAISFGLMILWTPAQLDNLVFEGRYLDVNAGESAISIQGLVRLWQENRIIDNGRLSNIAILLFSFSSAAHIIFAILSALTFTFTSALILSIWNRRPLSSPTSLASLWLLMLVFLPWRDSLYISAYTLNYLFSTAFCISLIAILTRLPDKFSGLHPFRAVGILLLIFLTACWHEGFACSSFAGLGLYLLIFRRHSVPLWIALSLFALFIILWSFSPGTLQRMDNELEANSLVASIPRFIFDYLILFFWLLSMAGMLLFRKGRRILSVALTKSYFIIFATTGLCGLIMSLILEHSARMSFFPNLCAIICLGIIFIPFISSHTSKRLKACLSVGAILLCMAQQSIALSWQYRLCREDSEISTLISNATTGSVFYDVILFEDVPFYTLSHPSRRTWSTPFHYSCWSRRLHHPVAVVPTALRYASLSKGTPLRGNAGARYLDGAIFAPILNLSNFGTREIDCIAVTPKGELPIRAMALPFCSASGDSLTYIRPIKMAPSDISSISVPEEIIIHHVGGETSSSLSSNPTTNTLR